jgi:hypothetical protein
MPNNFDSVLYVIRNTISAILGSIRESIKKDDLHIYPNEKEMRWNYISFELFAYLLFHLEVLLRKYQNENIRKQLFLYIVESVRRELRIDVEQFYPILQSRMNDYCSVVLDAKLEPDKRTEKHLNNFLDKLSYAIYSKDLYQRYDSTKVMATYDLMQFYTLRSLYNSKLMPIYDTFIVTHKNLFMAKSDFTKLSSEELAAIRKTTRKEIREPTLSY